MACQAKFLFLSNHDSLRLLNFKSFQKSFKLTPPILVIVIVVFVFVTASTKQSRYLWIASSFPFIVMTVAMIETEQEKMIPFINLLFFNHLY